MSTANSDENEVEKALGKRGGVVAGYGNSNTTILFDDVVVRVEKRRRSEAFRKVEVEVLKSMEKAGLRTPRIVGTIALQDGRVCSVFSRIVGEHLKPNKERAIKVARLLGQCHSCLKQVALFVDDEEETCRIRAAEGESPSAEEILERAIQTVKRHRGRNELLSIIALADQLLMHAQQLKDVSPEVAARGVVHLDMNWTNWLWDCDGECWLLDWDFCTVGYLLLDLGMALEWAVVGDGQWDAETGQAMLSAYLEEAPHGEVGPLPCFFSIIWLRSINWMLESEERIQQPAIVEYMANMVRWVPAALEWAVTESQRRQQVSGVIEPASKRHRSYPDEFAKDKKRSVNQWLCDAIQQHGELRASSTSSPPAHFVSWQEMDTLALVLDAPSFQTSRALISQGICARPNDIVVCNSLQVEEMKEALKNAPDLEGLHFVPLYSGVMLGRNLRPNSVFTAFLDYTCTLEGSGPIRPKKEIAAAFSRQVFKPGSVLAFTFHCPRNVALSASVDAAVDFLVSEAHRTYGHPALVIERRTYENVASQLMFICIKI